MCDYVYLDGNFRAGETADVVWDDSYHMFYWRIDIRRLKNYNRNQKIFVSVQQIVFRGLITTVPTDRTFLINTSCELITNLRLKNCFNSYGQYNVLALCDTEYDFTTKLINTNTSNNNNSLRFEVDEITDIIQLGVNFENAYIDFSDDDDCKYFKCLLKFEYEDIN